MRWRVEPTAGLRASPRQKLASRAFSGGAYELRDALLCEGRTSGDKVLLLFRNFDLDAMPSTTGGLLAVLHGCSFIGPVWDDLL
jgi:hypothetical protein